MLPEKGPAEVRATAKALNSLSSRLKSAMESRMRLVAAAGHDLRTPITRMRLRAEFVEDEEDRARWLTDLDELERIADSAILLVREESGKAPPELIQLDELVGSIGSELRDQNLDVTETTTEPVKVRASRLTLNRALRNLIINAATQGSSTGRGRRGEGAARIVIEDEGPGIPPELLGQVFEPFFRADPARRQDIRGAGLGLTIAREIIQRAGGKHRHLQSQGWRAEAGGRAAESRSIGLSRVQSAPCFFFFLLTLSMTKLGSPQSFCRATTSIGSA